ncbi:hypothetical protein [Magnetofaba australis]|nr:hypothetical protein [Magnetofaba australis]
MSDYYADLYQPQSQSFHLAQQAIAHIRSFCAQRRIPLVGLLIP